MNTDGQEDLVREFCRELRRADRWLKQRGFDVEATQMIAYLVAIVTTTVQAALIRLGHDECKRDPGGDGDARG